MSKHETEVDARILIHTLHRQAGWAPTDKSQVRIEVSVSGPAVLRDATAGAAVLEEEEESRRTDYVLLAANGRPLAVTEAKRGRIDPHTAKQQVLPMAKCVGAPFIFLSNGELTYFWDYENGDARILSSLYSRRDLERLLYLRKAFLGAKAGGKPWRRCELHADRPADDTALENRKYHSHRHFAKVVPVGTTLNLPFWSRKAGGEKLHPRFLLTETPGTPRATRPSLRLWTTRCGRSSGRITRHRVPPLRSHRTVSSASWVSVES
jgi:hypothetical protein